MGHPRKMFTDEGMHFVTVRVVQSRMMLRPSPLVNKVVGGILAKAMQATGVKVYWFTVMSNHMHLLVGTKGVNLSSFMQRICPQISTKIGFLVKWKGAFWQGRYSSAPVLDDAAAESLLVYMMSHGVKEGLVAHPEEWPGLTAYALLRNGGAMTFPYFHWSRRYEKGLTKKQRTDPWGAHLVENFELQLTPLPSWEGFDKETIAACVDELVKDIVKKGKATYKKVMGVKAILAQDPQFRPEKTKRSPKPLCHASTRQAASEYRETYVAWVVVYMEASARLRSGEKGVEFPKWAFQPVIQVNARS